MNIHQIIFNKRKELGMTQQDLAYKLGVASKSISRWENGLSTPDIYSLKQLTKVLNIPMTTFFKEIESSKDIESPIDTKLVSRYITFSIISITILLIATLLLWIGFTNYDGSDDFMILQILGLVLPIISVSLYIISFILFQIQYRTQQRHLTYYKHLKYKYLTFYVITLILCFILIVLMPS